MIFLVTKHAARVYAAAVLFIMVVGVSPSAGSQASPEMRRLISNAGMTPWTWQPISLDEPLRRGLDREKVPLRHFVTGDKPLLVYMYAYY